jgi:uncharacterized protein
MAALDRPFSVDLRGLGEGRHEQALTAPGDSLELPGDFMRIDGEVRLDLVLTITGNLIRAQGVVRATLQLTCGRCLEPFENGIEMELDLVLRSGPDGIRMEDEDETAPFLGEDWIAFDAPVREALILSVPIKPLCRPECRGLCPMCGENLNVSSCSCGPQPEDSRWDALRSLLDDSSKE